VADSRVRQENQFKGALLITSNSNKEMIRKNIVKGYKDEAYPPVPTSNTRFWRKFFPWQVVRFFVLNLKIMRIIIGGHS
jgi:hypothetical protein